MARKIRVATTHVSPIFLNAAETTKKAITLIHLAASNKANLIVFPETYIPAFPVWSSLQAPTLNHKFFTQIVQQSLSVDSPEIASIRTAARTNNITVSLGFSEKASSHSCGTLYNSNLLIGSNGDILVHHRKLMPTFFEKLTWSPGDGYGLRVAETEYAKVGVLICGENTNPLARYALMAQGEEIHISTWPAIWPTRTPNSKLGQASESQSVEDAGERGQVNDSAEEAKKEKNYDNVAANRIRAAAHCFEAKCFGILCASFMDGPYIDVLCAGAEDPVKMREALEASSQGASMFLDPTGAVVPGFVIDENGVEKEMEFLQGEEGVLYAEFDLDDCIEGKQYHDVTGGYQRMDVFKFEVDRTRKEPAIFHD